jgi:WD40 repeat protein/transcriptional regulator with XRE-family HTH domain
MKRSLYDEADYAFGQLILTLRTQMGLTQARLAERLGVSRRAVSTWELGSHYPASEHLKAFIALAVQLGAWAAGREAGEIRALWRAAHQKVLLDERWLQGLLGTQPPRLALVAPQSDEQTAAQPAPGPLLVWGDALDVPSFYGREEELALLSRWVVEERCRVVSVLGMGGIGKSALTVTAMHQVAEHFEVVIFRSLRDAPSCETLVEGCLRVLTPDLLQDLPNSLEARLGLLLEQFRARRVLLVLDNLEMLLEEGEGTGRIRADFEEYARLLRRMGETTHQSCLLLTSREKPANLVPLEGSRSPVRAMRLAGLDAEAGEQLLAEKEVMGSLHDRERLVKLYAGNPLALKIVAQTIADLFEGEIAPFLAQSEVVFGGVRELLDEHFARLSALEQRVLLWLAIVREPISIEQLLGLLVPPLSRAQVLEALEALHQRSLIERGRQPGSFTLHSVVLEYATGRLLTEATSEIKHGQLVRLIEHGLELAKVKEYLRQTQQRLLVAPLLAQVRDAYLEQDEVEEHLTALLALLRARADYAQGYGPANLLALLREQRGHLRGLDLSQLSLRGAFLQGVEMQDASLARATVRDVVFTESFDAIRGVAISPDGHLWATGSRRGNTQVWREGGKTLYLAWQAHTDTIRALAFSPDGATLATGSWDGAIKLWDLERGTLSGEQVSLLWTNWLPSKIQRIAFAPDGRTLASGGGDGTIRLWNTSSGTHLGTLPSQNSPVQALAWSPDGRLLASGSQGGNIRIWERPLERSDASVQVLAGHATWVTGLAFAPDGRRLASGSVDRTVKLWEVASGRCLQTLTAHTNPVFALAWSADGRLLASSDRDHLIWLWDVEHGRYRAALSGHEAGVYAIAFTPDSSYLLSSSDDGTLRLWDVERGECVQVLQSYAVSLYDIAWSPDGTKIASAGTDTLVTIWDMGEGRSLSRPRVLRGHSWVVHGVTWSPDGKMLASSGWDSTIRVWDATTGAGVKLLQDPDHVDALIFGVAWSPDGKWLAGASTIRGVQLWEVNTGIRRWIGQTDGATVQVAWSPDGTRLASCSDDGSVCLWDASSGREQLRLVGHRGMVRSVAWSPDGRQMASGSGNHGQGDNGEIFVWDAHSGERIHALVGYPGAISALTWTACGERLISGGSDGTVRWWNVLREECVRIQQAHQGTVQSLLISPNGGRLASCGDDGAIRLWDFKSGEPLQTLRRDRPYERLNITGIRGLSEAQKASLRALGAFEETSVGG